MHNLEQYFFLFSINFAIIFSYCKISNFINKNKYNFFILAILAIALPLFHIYINIPVTFKFIFEFLFYVVFFSTMSKIEFYNSFVITLVSIAICFVLSEISAIITAGIIKLCNIPHTHVLVFIIYSFLQIVSVLLFFKIKRFKNGYPFLKEKNKNIYICNYILLITLIIIFTYFFIAGPEHISILTLVLSFIVFSLIFIIVIQQNFILYQKQKLQIKTLKEYEQELQQTKQKLSTAISEKQNLVKSNHEFYHRQKAIERKLDLLLLNTTKNPNVEFGEDYEDIYERLNQLSKEYSEKTNVIPELPKTNIEALDDMFSYMQHECLKNNIEFILQINCDINTITERFINQSNLETLLGDLINNAIIAVNHSNNEYKSIMVILGIKNDIYELCVLDSGIPFEINTLVNLGLAPASTHLDEGGTGIGFVTTFETLNKCNSSIVINELLDNNYTKSIEIKFDNKSDYIIISDRINEINNCNTTKRKIILKNGN